MTNLKSFHGDKKIKSKYVARVIAHQKADNLVKGATGSNGKGCAVACTLDMVYDHTRYPIELGIPEWLARLEDSLFEGMSVKKSKTFPEKFLKAIKVGVDLEKVKVPFLCFILKESIKSMEKAKFDKKANPEIVNVIKLSKDAILQMIEALETGKDLEAAESAAAMAAWSARSAAESAAAMAAWSARSAAESAARSAENAAWSAENAAWSAWSAAESAARSAAWSAESAARSAAWSAENAAWSARSAAESAARSAAFDKYADYLLKLLKECK